MARCYTSIWDGIIFIWVLWINLFVQTVYYWWRGFMWASESAWYKTADKRGNYWHLQYQLKLNAAILRVSCWNTFAENWNPFVKDVSRNVKTIIGFSEGLLSISRSYKLLLPPSKFHRLPKCPRRRLQGHLCTPKSYRPIRIEDSSRRLVFALIGRGIQGESGLVLMF